MWMKQMSIKEGDKEKNIDEGERKIYGLKIL